MLATILMCCTLSLAADTPPADPLIVESAQVTLIEEVLAPAREAGVLAAIEAREGDLVEEGQLLGQVEDDQARTALEQAAIELEIAKQQANNDVDARMARKSFLVAEAELNRAIDSNSRFPNSISQTEVERLRLAQERAALGIEQAERDLRLAQLTVQLKTNRLADARQQLERREIRAPLTGMVVEIYRRPGEWVNPGEQVLRIVRVDRLRVEAFLSARDQQRQWKGAAVTFSTQLNGKEEQFPGEVVFVNPEVEPVSSQFRIWVELLNRDNRLSPGLSGTLQIQPPADPAAGEAP